MRKPSTSLEGRAGLGEAPTTAMVRTPVRIARIASSQTPSRGAISRAPFWRPLFEKGVDSLNGVGEREIFDHRRARKRIGEIERLLDLVGECPLADRQNLG